MRVLGEGRRVYLTKLPKSPQIYSTYSRLSYLPMDLDPYPHLISIYASFSNHKPPSEIRARSSRTSALWFCVVLSHWCCCLDPSRPSSYNMVISQFHHSFFIDYDDYQLKGKFPCQLEGNLAQECQDKFLIVF